MPIMKNTLNQIKLAIADSTFGRFLTPVYKLEYRPYGKNKTETYSISRPFDRFEGGVIAYSFSSGGVRSFRYDRMISRSVSFKK